LWVLLKVAVGVADGVVDGSAPWMLLRPALKAGDCRFVLPGGVLVIALLEIVDGRVTALREGGHAGQRQYQQHSRQ